MSYINIDIYLYIACTSLFSATNVIYILVDVYLTQYCSRNVGIPMKIFDKTIDYLLNSVNELKLPSVTCKHGF